jgi:ferredoxin
LGERIRLWRKERAGVDAFARTFGRGGNADPKNSIQDVMSQVSEGAVNSDRIPVSDPDTMAGNIKEVARFFGADVVGICRLDQNYVYSHRAGNSPANGAKAGDPIHLPHQYAICLGFAGDYDRYLACNSRIADAEYQIGQKSTMVPTFMLAAYIREMGYPARAHCHSGYEVNPIPLAVNAGLGELGRHGMLIHEEYGARLHLAVVTTDLPLSVDEPVDIGVEDFCRLCMKCARNCPSYSISFEDKVVINGVEKWAINVDSCYKARLAGRHGQWANCLVCVTACPYNKRSAWWHTLAVWMLKQTPISLRPLCVKPLLWLDDLIWGRRPWRHMKWLHYDNASEPVTCNILACEVNHKDRLHKRLHNPKSRLRTAR